MRALLVSLAALIASPAMAAQAYPEKTITIVVPVAAGGSVDFLARLIAGRLADRLGKAVVVENKAGAGMVIGATSVARADPDGHTLLLGTSASHAINATLHKQLPYDPAADFIPIAHFASSAFALVVSPDLPIQTVDDIVTYSNSHALTYATAGPGTPHHLFAEMLKSVRHFEMAHVPYRGNVPAITDVVAGHVSLMFSDPSGMALIKEGKVRALGVSSAVRVTALPDVAPLAESGLPGFDAVSWVILFAPAGTPDATIDRLHTEMKALAALPETKATIENSGQIAVQTPSVAELRHFVKAEVVRWGKVVEQAGIARSQ